MEQHHLEKISHKKKFFFKSFIISVILMIIVCIIATLLFNFMANMNYKFYGVDIEDYGKIFVHVFALWKILILQFTLVPAIAMMCIEKHVKKEMAEY